MKVIITSTGDQPKSKFDLRFGRSAWLCVYDTETRKMDFWQNENKNVHGGAGTKTAEKAAELGAEQVISGDFGPKAKTLLEKMQIQMVVLEETNQTIESIAGKINNTKKQQ